MVYRSLLDGINITQAALFATLPTQLFKTTLEYRHKARFSLYPTLSH